MFKHSMFSATTVSPNFVDVITGRQHLKQITALAVIEPASDGGLLLSVYRESSMAKGKYSRDLHRLKDGKWIHSGKDKKKYPVPPYAPAGAYEFFIETVRVWTLKEISSDEMDELLNLWKKGKL